MLLWRGTDPFRQEGFAGTPDAMAKVYAYRKAVSELKNKAKKTSMEAEGSNDETAPTREPRPRGRGNSNRKGGGRGSDAAPAEKK